MRIFGSDMVDRLRGAGNVWRLPGGQILLPRVCGFCSGVMRAMAMLDRAVTAEAGKGTRFFLLGQIIHNPWVNEHFQSCGVTILSAGQVQHLEDFIGPADCGVIPAFGVPLAIERRLRAIGCRVLDTTCGDVRRLWAWAQGAVQRGFGVLIYGRDDHDETVVTKSRLEASGGKYLVVGNLAQAQRFCGLVASGGEGVSLRAEFGPQAGNAASLTDLLMLAQVSQTTMLFDDTMKVRELVRSAFEARFGPAEAQRRLLFQPTVCRATQERQAAASELCRAGCDVTVVVGGFGSSNTRHLYDLARQHGPAYFIEDAGGIVSGQIIRSFDKDHNQAVELRGWLPESRPLKIGVLAGASSPEVVIGEVLQRLAGLLSG